MKTNLLEQDEYPVASYKVQYVEWLHDDWIGRGDWLEAVITNHRLLLLPPKNALRGKPETIQYADIAKVWNLCLRKRDGVLVRLKSGQHLYLYVEWSQGNKLVNHLRERIAPTRTPRILPHLRTV